MLALWATAPMIYHEKKKVKLGKYYTFSMMTCFSYLEEGLKICLLSIDKIVYLTG